MTQGRGLDRVRAALFKLAAHRPLRIALTLAVLGVSLWYLLQTLDAQRTAFAALRLDGGVIGALALAAACYATLLALLGIGWGLSAGMAGRPGYRRSIVAVYGIAALTKYLPGSVVQYLSRQAIGARIGLGQAAMARASSLEIGLHIIVSGALGGLLLLAGTQPVWLLLAVPTLGLGALVTAKGRIARWLAPRPAPAIVCQLLFFAGFALLAMLVAGAIGIAPHLLVQAAGLFLLSWLAGFLVPVAPGGIGVREAAGVALMAPVLGGDAALALQLAMRLMTLAGDALLFALALVYQRDAAAMRG